MARELIEAGIPVFVAKPATDSDGRWDPGGGHNGTGYWLPSEWQKTEPDLRVLDDYRPGDALGMVCGHKVDGVDTDPCNGGDKSRAALEAERIHATHLRQGHHALGRHPRVGGHHGYSFARQGLSRNRCEGWRAGRGRAGIPVHRPHPEAFQS